MFGLVLAAVIVGTWNGNWFPSGRAEHRAHPKVEEATTIAAAEMLNRGIAAFDEGGTNDVVIILNEMRSPEVVSNLVEKINRPGLRVASVSRYRRRDRFDQQQDAIITTLSVVNAGWSLWPMKKGVKAPRGSAYATLVFPGCITSEVHAVHLKSNYGATSEKIKFENAAKRKAAVDALCSRTTPSMIIAGDFNADRDRSEFLTETIFEDLENQGFVDVTRFMPKEECYTHPNKRWGNSLLDYIFVRTHRVKGEIKRISSETLSDHDALFCVLDR